MSERKPELDLIRSVALLFVVIFHSFLNNGYYFQPQTGFAMFIANTFRWLSVSCIGLFLMLTGYLKSQSRNWKDCCRSLLPVLLGYALASAISIPVRHFFLREVQPLNVWLSRFFSFQGVYYGWYVEMYLGLVLVMPFLNILINALRRIQLLGFIGVLLFLTALPGVLKLPGFPDYWRFCYPITYYCLGAALKRLQPKIPALVGLTCAILLSAGLGLWTLLSTDGTISDAAAWEFADLWIVLISVSVFVSLYRLRLPLWSVKILKFAANGCYGGYLLSHLLDDWCYRLLPQWHKPEAYWKLFLAMTVPIYLTSILGGWLLERLTKGIICLGKGRRAC